MTIENQGEFGILLMKKDKIIKVPTGTEIRGLLLTIILEFVLVIKDSFAEALEIAKSANVSNFTFLGGIYEYF